MASNVHQIKNGPSKWALSMALVVALFDEDPRKNRRLVNFWLADDDTPPVNVTIRTVDREDGSGESFNITGYAGSDKVFIYYSTQSRKGTFRTEP